MRNTEGPQCSILSRAAPAAGAPRAFEACAISPLRSGCIRLWGTVKGTFFYCRWAPHRQQCLLYPTVSVYMARPRESKPIFAYTLSSLEAVELFAGGCIAV